MIANGTGSLVEGGRPRSFLMRLFASKSTARMHGSPDSQANSRTASSADTVANHQSKKILIVDDDPVILKTTSLKLKSRGYQVVTAMDGPGAISAVRKEKPDLILLDISLPQHVETAAWDGLLVMSWLRRLEEARNIPFIVITGGDPMQYKSRSLAAGALAFFHKPIDHGDLLSVIERTVTQPATGQSTECVPTFQI
jgi:CheY-like chemotaxis protein